MLIKIRKLDEDIDAPHVEIIVSHCRFATSQDSYISDEEFVDFGKALQTFPQNLKHEVIFENGSLEPNSYCYIRLRAFVYDGVGHTALEVFVESHSEVPYASSSHFYIVCEAATLNRLGRLLENWISSKDQEFEYQANAV